MPVLLVADQSDCTVADCPVERAFAEIVVPRAMRAVSGGSGIVTIGMPAVFAAARVVCVTP
jgi:hypothetical protein